MKQLDDLTTRCIRCGFCLESCPTFLVTGNEMESPRGRIYLVRSADEGLLDWQEDVKPHLDQCLGCLGCETACPSGVEYGQILELARDKIEEQNPIVSKKLLLTGTTNTSILRLNLLLGGMLPGKRIPGFISKLLSGQRPEADLPQVQVEHDLPPLDESTLPPVRGEVFFLEGCAMRVLYPRVHSATRRLLRRIGYVVREAKQGCCGALHVHNGYYEEAQRMAERLADELPGDLPVIVNSAGCGSTMKNYGELIGAEAFARRVKDASEFLLANGLIDQLGSSPGLEVAATYHDACHLAHGQRISSEPRQLLQAIPRLELRPLAEADLCCGSAGIYNVLQPKMARELLERKYANIEATGAAVVATGNPGCHAWIAQAAREHGRRVHVLHTMELLEAAFIGLEHFDQETQTPVATHP